MNKDTDNSELIDFLNDKYIQYCRPQFIETDPIQIPHAFTQRNDIEISAFLAATISWGNRTAIVKTAKKMMELMDNAPSDFVINSKDADLKKISNFVYRTFNSTDLLFFVASLKNIYENHGGLKTVFEKNYATNKNIAEAIIAFRKIFFEIPFPEHTCKHVANVEKNSSAKRINMFLRWMVRKPTEGVDFGLWDTISPASLYLPLDVHTGNVTRKLGILSRKQNDWKSVTEVTNFLRLADPADPVKYDFALFGLGIFENF